MNKKSNQKKIYLKSYGCQMNVYDTNQLLNLFESDGYKKTSNIENADLVILNTCHIRDKAVEKVYSDIGRIKKIVTSKNNFNKKTKLVVSGCVAQAEGEEIKKRAPIVDFVVGPQSYHKLPKMIKEKDNFLNDAFLQNEKFKNLLFKSSNKVSGFITVQEGCDKFCSFCVVPYTRGSEFSRSVKEILEETKIYTKNGTSEIILLGQNVNAYHGSSIDNKEKDLAYLINKISEIDQIKRIRYMTSHPNDMSDSLINCHATNEKLMPFIHLPIQSGSNEVLKAMNRKHTVEKYIEIINNLRFLRKDIAISSDFIVGFPSEKDEDFDETMQLIEKIKFVIAYSFMYSPRPGTPASNYKQIDISIKKARLNALQSLTKSQQSSYNNSFVNKVAEVLFEKKGRYKNQYIGRSIYNQSVFVENEKNLIGQCRDVLITRSTNFALEGNVFS